MLVSDVLRRKGDFVATIPPDTPVTEVLAELAKHNVGALVVSVDGARVTGIVSERDVVRALQSRGPQVLTTEAAQIMTTDVDVAAPDDHLEQLMRVMTEQRIRHLPVVAQDRIVGVVSIGDVVKSRMDELEAERANLIGYISSSG